MESMVSMMPRSCSFSRKPKTKLLSILMVERGRLLSRASEE